MLLQHFAPPLVCALLLAVAAQAGAAVEGSTPDGVRYASGGVSAEEQAALRGRFNQFTLRVATAAKGSGAHLASVQARITDAAGKLVLEHRLEGPWLLANLPAGRYRVELRNLAQNAAAGSEQVERRDVTVAARRLTELTVHFEAPADTASGTGSAPRRP